MEHRREHFHDQCRVAAIGIQIRVEYRYRHAAAQRILQQLSPDIFQPKTIDTGAAGGIHRRHHGLIQHVHIEVQPKSLRWLGGQHLVDMPYNFRPAHQVGGKNIDTRDGSLIDIRPGEIHVVALSLTQL